MLRVGELDVVDFVEEFPGADGRAVAPAGDDVTEIVAVPGLGRIGDKELAAGRHIPGSQTEHDLQVE